jgi:hypothetical protein
MNFGTRGCMYCEGECNKECLLQEEPKAERMYSEEDIIEFSEWADTSKESSDFWRKNRRSPTMDNSHHIYIREKRLELFQIWKEQFKKK